MKWSNPTCQVRQVPGIIGNLTWNATALHHSSPEFYQTRSHAHPRTLGFASGTEKDIFPRGCEHKSPDPKKTHVVLGHHIIQEQETLRQLRRIFASSRRERARQRSCARELGKRGRAWLRGPRGSLSPTIEVNVRSLALLPRSHAAWKTEPNPTVRPSGVSGTRTMYKRQRCKTPRTNASTWEPTGRK